MRVERQALFWLAAAIAVVLALLVLKDVLLPFVAGLVIAYAVNPLTERLVAAGLSRQMASAAVVAAAVLALVLAVIFLLPVLMAQLQQLSQSLPGEVEHLMQLLEEFARARLGSHFEDFKASLDQAMRSVGTNGGTIATAIARMAYVQGLAIVNFLSLLLITPLVVFYLLVDWHPMLKQIDGWLPRDHADTIRRLAAEIDSAISAFIRGQGLVCLILAAFYAMALSFAGVRNGLLVGLATGILSFVPFAGWALGLIVAGITALVQDWPDLMKLYIVIGIYAAGQALDAALLSPTIVGPRIGLHPVWLIFALFVFSYLFGFVGVLVAVPLSAAVAVLVRYALSRYLESSVYRGGAAAKAAPEIQDGASGKRPTG